MSSDMDAIVTTHLTKTYRVGIGRARVREMLPWPVDRVVRQTFPRWWGRDSFDALHDVSISVSAGSSVGLIGHNGAGKTTLLKVIAGVTSPTRGRVEVSGRVAALIDLLVAFIPDLTGRENLYYLASIHGLGRRAMAKRSERVIDFAEIDQDLLDTPVKRYSAGMMARLGFAVVTVLDAAILLIDEVLAVGDASFQRRCIQWLDDYKKAGGTLLFVSHNLSLVRNMTQRVVWLSHGQVVGDGPAKAVIPDYVKALELRDSEEAAFQPGPSADKLILTRGLYRWGAGGARVEEVHVGEPSSDGAALDIVIAYETSDLRNAVFCVGFVDEGGLEIGATASPIVPLETGKREVRCSVDLLQLRPGSYFPVVAILSEDGVVRDRWRLDRALVVERNGRSEFTDDFGPVHIAAAWSNVSGT
jgi:ABC-type polysaccharide/polyol phosphate transport system ATPase subunit